MIIQANYLGFLEQLVLRARALGKTEVSIPLFFFGTPGDTAVAIVRMPARTDSAIVSLGQSGATRLRVDEWGRIVSGQYGSMSISRVKFRAIFPPKVTGPTRCGNATHQARQALSLPALNAVFAYYRVTAADVASARALSDETDINVCRDMLDLFQVRAGPGEGQSLFEVGTVYVAIAGSDPARAGAAIVYADNLEVAHMISLGARRNEH